MKQPFCIALLILLPLLCCGQTAKGTWVLGASIFSSTIGNQTIETQHPFTNTKQTAKSYNFSLGPSIGKFVTENLSVGISAGFHVSHSSTETEGRDQNSENGIKGFSVGPYIEYFFGQNPKGKPYVQVSANYGMGNEESSSHVVFGSTTMDYSYEGNRKSMNAFVHAGYAFFLNESIRLKIFLGYGYSNNKTEGTVENSGYDPYDIKDTVIDSNLVFGAGISTVLKTK